MRTRGSENIKQVEAAVSVAKGINRRDFVQYGERAMEGWKKEG